MQVTSTGYVIARLDGAEIKVKQGSMVGVCHQNRILNTNHELKEEYPNLEYDVSRHFIILVLSSEEECGGRSSH